MRQVVWTLGARGDLERAVRFIARENPGAAARLLDLVALCAETMVAEHLGRVGRVTGTYEVLVPRTRYIVAYRIAMSDRHLERAEILHVIHTSREWKSDEWPE